MSAFPTAVPDRTSGRRPGLAVWILLLLAACGDERAPGGRGTVSQGNATRGAPRLVTLKGSPYQMGWWHGHLLKDEIQRFLPRWRDRLFIDTVGVPYAERQHAAARALRETIELYVDQCQHRMRERLKQEYDGLAAGCGMSVYELVEMEVLRDVLRTKGLDARLTGSLAATVTGTGLEVRGWWAGKDAKRLSDELLLIRREPTGSTPHTVLTWPGSLGALAGVRTNDGYAVLSAELDITEEHRRGFSGGQPFALTVRTQLEYAQSFRELAGLTGTMGHAVLSADGVRRAAVGSVETSAAGEEIPQFLGDVRFLAVGPYERLPGPRADALAASANEPTLSLTDRFARVRRHADGKPETDVYGPHLTLTWNAKGVLMVVRREPGGMARRASYKLK